ncbi:MAG: DUF554 family protein, partial [Synergistaceae bacterium]|nr:DUF554 family protein [Synergistaceae bacterium]
MLLSFIDCAPLKCWDFYAPILSRAIIAGKRKRGKNILLEIFKSIPAGGTVFNSLAVIFGSSIGIFAGRFISEKMNATIFNCLGLFTIYVGI